jgi:hypothetical protein
MGAAVCIAIVKCGDKTYQRNENAIIKARPTEMDFSIAEEY